MRNLDQYPVTIDEMIEAIEWSMGQEHLDWEARGRPLGDVRGPALRAILAKLQTIKWWVAAIKDGTV